MTIPRIIFIVVLLFAGVIGCSQPVVPDMVSGTVTVEGKPVTGEISFIGSDGKQVSSPVGPTKGVYSVANAPKGEVTIVVRSSSATVPPTGGGAAAGAAGTVAPMTTNASAEVPTKYTKAETSDLRYTVKPGKHEHNIELTP